MGINEKLLPYYCAIACAACDYVYGATISRFYCGAYFKRSTGTSVFLVYLSGRKGPCRRCDITGKNGGEHTHTSSNAIEMSR